MSRNLSNSIQAESEKSVVEPFILAELLFEGDPVRAWNGVGDLTWDGKTWTGVGDLGGVEPMRETQNLQARGVAFSMSGIPSSMLSLALNANYHGRIARLYLGFFDGTGVDESAIVADPFVIREGYMDQMVIVEAGETAQIQVKAESRLIRMQRANEFLYDHEDQQALFPGDLGFEFVPSLQDKEIAWGVGASKGNLPRVVNKRERQRGGGGGRDHGGPGGLSDVGGIGGGPPGGSGAPGGIGGGPPGGSGAPGGGGQGGGPGGGAW